jgi:hypothetical protein
MSSRPECPDCGERWCYGKPDGSWCGQRPAVVESVADAMIRPEIGALAERGDITLEEWNALRINPWERELLIPKLDNAAFIHVTGQMVSSCVIDGRRPYITYDSAILGLIVPELVRRLGGKL